MRVRNPQTGTVLQLDTETANAYISAGWEDADKPTRSARSASSAVDDSQDSSSSETKTRRRRSASR